MLIVVVTLVSLYRFVITKLKRLPSVFHARLIFPQQSACVSSQGSCFDYSLYCGCLITWPSGPGISSSSTPELPLPLSSRFPPTCLSSCFHPSRLPCDLSRPHPSPQLLHIVSVEINQFVRLVYRELTGSSASLLLLNGFK